MKTLVITFSSFLLIVAAGCSSGSTSNTTRSAGIGAATGAVIGGVIGHQSGETGAGAAIGAAVGGVAGAAHGRQQDRRAQTLPPTGSSSPYPNSYSSSDYMNLMTQDEIAILQARARAADRSDYQLTDFLTEEEKANLRRRAETRREIGR